MDWSAKPEVSEARIVEPRPLIVSRRSKADVQMAELIASHHELRKEMTELSGQMARLTDLVEKLLASQGNE